MELTNEAGTLRDRWHRRGAGRAAELQLERGLTVARVAVGRDRAADNDHHAVHHDERPTPGGAKPGSTTTSAPPATTTTTSPPAAARSATGSSVNYNYGILSVKVSVSGSKITNVSIASINDGGNPRSQYIDQQSIPLLEQQALSAQSANIQGVSGASYTTAGFAQSLQSALTKLGL